MPLQIDWLGTQPGKCAFSPYGGRHCKNRSVNGSQCCQEHKCQAPGLHCNNEVYYNVHSWDGILLVGKYCVAHSCSLGCGNLEPNQSRCRECIVSGPRDPSGRIKELFLSWAAKHLSD